MDATSDHMKSWMLASLTGWLTGCTYSTLYTSPTQLEAARRAIHDGHAATIQVEGDPEVHELTVDPTHQVEIENAQDPRPVRLTMSLDHLFATCAPAGDEYPPTCALAPGDRFVKIRVGERRHFDDDVLKYIMPGLAGGVLVAGAIGLGYCTVDCDRPWNIASGAVLVAAGIAIVANLALSSAVSHPSWLLPWHW
jgi:hypothetical protein